MRTFFIVAASALVLAGATELIGRAASGSPLFLLSLAVAALICQGYLAIRLTARAPAAAAATAGETAAGRTSPGDAPRSRKPRGDGDRKRDQDRDQAGGKPARRASPAAEASTPAVSEATGEREEGTVKWFNRTKGFGFIVRASGEEIFVHQRSIRGNGGGGNEDARRRASLKDGQKVSFVVAVRDKGPQAEDVAAL